MILKGSQRSGGKQLATHLLNDRDNEHVELHDLRGFSADTLHGAFHEAYATSRGTRAKQYLFSLSLSPPPNERVTEAQFRNAIEATERALGLQGQPRAIVFHEKDGRRHAHAVWSRIDTNDMKAINLPHFKLKLREVSRQFYREHGWTMPRGFANSKERDPANFTRAEWEQAKRAKQDPKALKTMFQDCWTMADHGKAFAQALQARGYTLAQGDRRGPVAVDFKGEAYAISKWVGVRSKAVTEKLGPPKDLPTVEQASVAHAERISERLRLFIAEADTVRNKQMEKLTVQKNVLVERQRQERTDLNTRQQQRWDRETTDRASRLNKGVKGLWDRVTGRHGRQERENQQAALQSLHRGRREKDGLIERHLNERESFHQQAKDTRAAQSREVAQLHRDLADTNRRTVMARPSVLESHRRKNSIEFKQNSVHRPR